MSDSEGLNVSVRDRETRDLQGVDMATKPVKTNLSSDHQTH
jgi:hypothetical protein